MIDLEQIVQCKVFRYNELMSRAFVILMGFGLLLGFSLLAQPVLADKAKAESQSQGQTNTDEQTKLQTKAKPEIPVGYKYGGISIMHVTNGLEPVAPNRNGLQNPSGGINPWANRDQRSANGPGR